MLLMAGLIAVVAWIAVTILVLAMCVASSRADTAAEHSYRSRQLLEI